ncbi:MAG: hypothetical protein QM775_24565 [Pirellulales bacterium]
MPEFILRMFDADGDGKLNAEEEAKFREDLHKRQAARGENNRPNAGRPVQIVPRPNVRCPKERRRIATCATVRTRRETCTTSTYRSRRAMQSRPSPPRW